MRTLAELVDTADPGWPLVMGWLSQASVSVEVLPVDPRRADQVLLEAQITTRSPMGAIIHATGGLFIDDGWLRVLGSGHDQQPRDLSSWNAMLLPMKDQRLPGACLFADDVVGGFFALNGNAFDAQPGYVQYFAPDTLEWEDLKMTYSQFLVWACNGRLARFYESSRWQGWQVEVRAMSGDKGFSVYPFLWAEGPPVAERSRRSVPIEELWGLQIEMRTQLRKAQG